MRIVFYFFIIFFYSFFAHAKWFSNDIYIECSPSNIFVTNDSKKLLFHITDTKWCVIDIVYYNEKCAMVSTFNSNVIKTINLTKDKSTTAEFYNEDVYWMLNRDAGNAAVYSSKTNKILSPVHTCKKREKI